MASELKAGIVDTYVVSGHGLNNPANFTTTDKLYLLSPKEVYGSDTWYNNTEFLQTRQLDYYKNSGVSQSNYGGTVSNLSGAIKQYNVSNTNWWLRAASSYNSNKFYGVTTSGDWYDPDATRTYGVAPAFRIE